MYSKIHPQRAVFDIRVEKNTQQMKSAEQVTTKIKDFLFTGRGNQTKNRSW